MALADVVRQRFSRSIALYRALIETLPESALAARLPGARSNTLGAQLWCVVGARESYVRALRAGAWKGFACSLTREDCTRRERMAAALADSGAGLLDVLEGIATFDAPREGLLMDALEHEAAHQGQVIRYLYALDLDIPKPWAERYALR